MKDEQRFPLGMSTPAIVVDINKDLIRFRGTVRECEDWISGARARSEQAGVLPDDMPEYEVEPDQNAIADLKWRDRL